MRLILALFLLSSTAFAALPVPTENPLNLYIAPGGSDSNSGISPIVPLQTLSGAQAVLKAFNPQQNVIINVAPGTYYNQSVVWTWVRPDYAVTIKGSGSTKPIFDGCDPSATCTQKTFFILNSKTGQPTNITIDGLQVQRYWMGISLNGDYKNFGAYNWNNVISNNTFQDIGNVFSNALPYSYAAVRLYNSRNNKVMNNTFKNIINVGDYGGYIHAVYAASWASSNLISGNTFENVSGDVVRVRDTSNNNRVEKSTFRKAGLYALASDWYCSGDACDKIECPSWENVFDTNTYGLNYQLQSIRPVYASGSNTSTGCSAPSATSTRIKALNSVLSIQ